MRTLVLTAAASLLLGQAALAADACAPAAGCQQEPACGSADRCGVCGRNCACLQKVCQLQTGTREVVKTVWQVKCEEFCPLLPGCGRCCQSCGEACDGACCGKCKDCCDPCAVEKAKCFITPKCGRPHERKTLERKEVVCKVPAFKCVVVYCCPSCPMERDPARVQ